MREALEQFLIELAARRASPHTVAAYRRDVTRVFDLSAGPGKPMAPEAWTRDLLERTKPDDIGVSVAYPLPGTKFFELVKRDLGAKRNWEESNDLDMMFFGTYRSEFYRSVRNLLHEQVVEGPTPGVRRRWDELTRGEAQFRRKHEVPAATRVAAHQAP